MLREFENIYIETYSAWEKYRKAIIYRVLAAVIVSLIISFLNFWVGELIFYLSILTLIVFGIYARRNDFQDVKKQSAKKEFKNYDYKRAKFEQMKDKIALLLKQKNMYNKESLEVIIHSFEGEMTKYDKVSTTASILSIILAVIGLKQKLATIVILIFAAAGTGLLISFVVEWILKYILVNKVKYNELVNALVEIELEVINSKKKKNYNSINKE
ncbi:MAG: hypothetical protein IKL68_01065 [Clostridia bacterium]|nr:hypothetical protein [Clostridia bacterium]